MRRTLSIVLGLMLLFSVLTFGTVKAVVIKDDFEILDTSTWTVGGSAGSYGTVTVESGELHLHLNAQSSWGGSHYDKYVESVPFGLTDNTVIEMKVKTAMSSTHVSLGFGLVDEAGNWVVEFYGLSDTNKYELRCGGQALAVSPYTEYSVYRFVFGNGTVVVYRDGSEVTSCAVDVQQVKIMFLTDGWNDGYADIYVDYVIFDDGLRRVNVSLKDGLTGKSLSGVTVKENGTVIGTIDDGGTLELAKGTHTLTFEKQGYWSETVTVDVQNDTSVSVEMYPDTAAFRVSAPANITTFENTITEVTFTVSPIKTEAAYNAYLSLSGLTDVIEVKEGANTLSPEAGKYYLGDISGETQVTVKFRAAGRGTKAFTFTITSQDALGTKTYTTTKQVVYEVQPLPFQVQLPSTWAVGENSVRINEASGQQVLITLSLLDSQGTEVWTDSYSFGPYEGHSFTVNIPAEGTYTLKASWAGYTATWSVEVNPAISIVQDTITVKKGEVGTVRVHIKNPSSSTQYYTITLEGGFIEDNVTKAVAIAPLSERTVEIAFSVPKQLDFDAYDLTLKVLQGSAVQYQGTVHVIIDGSGGLSLPLAGGSGNTLLLLGAAGAALVVAGLVISRRR